MQEKTSKLWVRDDAVLLTVKNLPNQTNEIALIFEALAQRGINIDLICQTPPNSSDLTHLSFSLSEKDLTKVLPLIAELQRKRKKIKTDVSTGNTKLTVSCEAMRSTPGIAAEIFRSLAEISTETKMINTSETEISLLIAAQDEDKTVAKLKEILLCY